MAAPLLVCPKLQDWANANVPSESLRYKDGYWDQIVFVRDEIAGALAATYEEFKAIPESIRVISTHVSKSVLLPVFQVAIADGTVFTMRYNFHDWKISVSSPRDVVADFMGLFDYDERILDIYCEGFPEGLVYGPYAENKRQFTVELSSGYFRIFTFFWIFGHQVLRTR